MSENLSLIHRITRFPLWERSSLRLGGECDAFFPATTDQLISVVRFFASRNIPYKVLGRASNVLPRDTFHQEKMIFTDGISFVHRRENTVTVGCGVRMSRLIFSLSKEGISLLPQLIGVPGSVGGMVYQNASCYGAELAEAFVCSSVYDPLTDTKKQLTKEEMQFSYRASRLKSTPWVLLEATFSIRPDGGTTQIIRDVTMKRRARAPEGPSLGSVFLKNDGVSIGYLLDRLNQRGRCFGGICVSERHAGILINKRNGTSREYLNAIDVLGQLIFEHHGFVPQCEIELLR